MNETHQSYDIIGDIHGHATELEVLLDKLGYRKVADRYCHPQERKAIYLGDYIDRGPKNRRVLRIVRGMVESGDALAILGNHEVNALRFHARDNSGNPLRVHSPRNVRQHQATLDQIADPHPEEWAEWLAWFSTLPLWIDLGALRVTHAAWDEPSMNVLRDIGPLQGHVLEEFSHKGSFEYESMSKIINGPEATIANGLKVPVQGEMRNEIRLRWWEGSQCTNARDAIYPSIEIPPHPIETPTIGGYDLDAPPVFFGHYAAPRDQALVAPNAACLDHGIGKGGLLSAYRWDGENKIDPQKFVN